MIFLNSTPAPLPVEVLVIPTDWWIFGLTALGVMATAAIALLTLRATRIAEASRSAADAAQTRALEAYVTALNSSEAASNIQIRALEALVEKVNGATVATAERPTDDVRWTLERDTVAGRGRWIVRNVGTATAHDASMHGLSEQDDRDLYVVGDEPRDIEPYGLLQFSIERSLASPPATGIVINWADGLDNERTKRLIVA